MRQSFLSVCTLWYLRISVRYVERRVVPEPRVFHCQASEVSVSRAHQRRLDQGRLTFTTCAYSEMDVLVHWGRRVAILLAYLGLCCLLVFEHMDLI